MTVPLLVLAVFAVLLGFAGTPAWPWFQGYLTGEAVAFRPGEIFSREHGPLLLFSTLVVFAGIGMGWRWYGRQPARAAGAPDVIERYHPALYRVLREKFYVDELYAGTVVRWHAGWAWACDAMDRLVWGGVVLGVGALLLALSWVSRWVDDYVVNLGFDDACRRIARGGAFGSRMQGGHVHEYLRALALALVVLLLVFVWGSAS